MMNQESFYDIVIVGAGASGLMSACLLACSGKSVLVLEKESRVGRKLSATGNGRCNLTNLDMDWKHYYGDRSWVDTVLQQVSPERVIGVFEELGVLTREKDGYVYPHSNQAATVIGALYRGCRKPGITIELEQRVTEVLREPDRFEVVTEDRSYECDTLLLATGGPAGLEQGGCDDGYGFLRSLGHTVTTVYPGLTGMHAAGRWWKDVAGTRVQGGFTLFVDGKRQGTEVGEIQITKTGVSGIPVFQMCRLAAEGLSSDKQVYGEIDFVPAMDQVACERWIAMNGIEGLVPTKWIAVLGNGKKTAAQLAKEIKHFEFTITDTYGIEKAQVSAGGVPVGEVSPESFASRRCPGLYVLGELVDVDGLCGGYNLHLAWSSAILATEDIKHA
ncbi:MAG: aminoacetone oxidase family FAD-binding enzyme [Eubacterium sp.]|nr:aminoacetone oxidase family FAD-binding enzyme [Eubacterium sp.]